jgi:hypothetical protein
MTDSFELLDEIRSLEESFYRRGIRRSRAEAEKLLTEDFAEFESSGRSYNREDMIALLVQEGGNESGEELSFGNYALSPISANAVLLTYRTCRKQPGGLERHVLRSSIWKRSESGWKMMFHQGTKTEAKS